MKRENIELSLFFCEGNVPERVKNQSNNFEVTLVWPSTLYGVTMKSTWLIPSKGLPYNKDTKDHIGPESLMRSYPHLNNPYLILTNFTRAFPHLKETFPKHWIL